MVEIGAFFNTFDWLYFSPTHVQDMFNNTTNEDKVLPRATVIVNAQWVHRHTAVAFRLDVSGI